MNLETAHLLQALGAVAQHTPGVVRELASGQMSPERQRQYGGLLIELGGLLEAHAAATNGLSGEPLAPAPTRESSAQCDVSRAAPET